MREHLNGVRRVACLLQNVAVTVVTGVGSRPVPALLARTVEDIEEVAQRGPPLSLEDLPAFIDAVRNLNAGINDREFLLEKLLVLMSRLPDDSGFAKKLEKHVIDILYKDLPHPPISYLTTFKLPTLPVNSGTNVPYIFRSANGSNYNGLAPSLGQAGQPYARSVPSTHLTPVSCLPDPGLVFDTLLRRGGDFVPHPGGLSSLFFAFADLIIHSIFCTDSQDWNINNASSYLDLSVIYGNSQDQVDSVRRKDGTGRLWEDVFADSRLLFMPPSVCALAILMSRHHNYIAENILSINERGTFASPPSSDEAAKLAQCDEIFHRARLVNTAFFMQIILGDYVGSILGLVRDGLSWRLDPLEAFRESGHDLSARGEGNAVSLEFNMLYRWHATISAHDDKWLTGLFGKIFEGKDPNTMSPKEFQAAVRKLIDPGANVRDWTFNNMVRGPDGRFNDNELARILHDATEHPAGAFRARGVPDVLRVAEILGIEQARTWGACTLNEFRKFIGLKPYASFKEWNPDPEIHKPAESLYGDINNLELHVGLQAEETKPPIPGAGLCPGYTVSRAILADAVCLTRGDRFLTVDFTPFNLTSWGYQQCMVEKSDGSFGGMLTRLLFRMLPQHYPAGSAYAHFPFLVPEFIHSRIPKMPASSVDLYTWSRPEFVGKESYQEAQASYDHRLSKLLHGKEPRPSSVSIVFLSRHLKANVPFAQIKDIIKETSISQVSFEALTRSLIAQHGVKGKDTLMYIDIAKDVLDLLPVHWAANTVIGLPMRTLSNPYGELSAEHWSRLFVDVSRYLYFNREPAHDWMLHKKATEAADQIMQPLQAHLRRLSDGIASPAGLYDFILTEFTGKNMQCNAFFSRILSSSKHLTIEEIACGIFAETIPSAALFSAALASVVDFYLQKGQKTSLDQLVKLCATVTPEADVQILAYVHKALYCSFDTGCAYDGPMPSHLVLGKQEVPLPYQNGLLSREIFAKIAPQILRVIFTWKDINRAVEPAVSTARMAGGAFHQDMFTPLFGDPALPSSLVIEYAA
ncbi:heme peroxidase [Leucogyrophana mollusca]|uniref:Heme peroxidase n=1 Tax=Leucogyrophana mollusca TaxID=85980 RepID=A0ACB8B249_9AGAM|nr:heme peroxidase [Leucogyrophana mollusca]